MSVSFEKLQDIAKVIDSLHKTPKYSETGYSMVRCTDVKYGFLNLQGTFKVSKTIFDEFSKRYEPSRNDIVITRVGTYGVTALVQDTEFCLGQNTSVIIAKNINPKYLYAVLNSSILKNQIEASVVGSTQKTLSLKAINNFEIPRFSPEVEDQIAKMISELDEKIHLNNQINQTLESIAQAIFKSWFIDFDPVRAKIAAKQEGKDPERAAMCAISGKSEVEIQQMAEDDFAELQATAALFPDELVESELGELPKGWVVSTVGEQVQTVGGGTPSTKNADFWDNGIHHWTTPKDLSNLTDKILLNTERKITDIGLKKISSGILPKDTVLMSSRAPVGYLALAKIEVAINQGYIAILPNTKYSAEYLIQWCEANMAEIKGRASGTTFQEISKKNFREINFISSDEKVVAIYTRTAKTLYDEITLKAKENQSLINLRDTLLPKLLSGEIEVENL
ncbi:restriction endonuclease subunit S [Acinetobacter sp. BSP-28]|uniref:restriction endonuclease subunit S n=1 Tax=Acinetobacter sp. BSP-28 TaxID=3344661 RepID=UPI00376F9EE7